MKKIFLFVFYIIAYYGRQSSEISRIPVKINCVLNMLLRNSNNYRFNFGINSLNSGGQGVL